MSNMTLCEAFPDLVTVPGVRRVSDVSETVGEPAMLVEFVDGVSATVTRSKHDRTEFAIQLKDKEGVSRWMNPSNGSEVMALLTDFAFVAANPNMPLHEVISINLNRKL